MFNLAHELAGRGHSVTFCAPPEQRENANGLHFVDLADSFRDSPLMRSKDGNSIAFVREVITYLRDQLRKQAETLLDVCAQPANADVLVTSGAIVAGPTISEALEIGLQVVVYAPQSLPSSELPPPMLPYRRLPRVLNAGLRELTDAGMELSYMGPLLKIRKHLGLGVGERLTKSYWSDEPILACDSELGPAPERISIPVSQPGYMHPRGVEHTLPAQAQQFIDAGPAPVYVGFGSMIESDPEALLAFAVDTVRATGRRGIVSGGWTDIELGEVADGILSVGNISHYALFPRVAVAIHHGGAGTTATAALGGTPQIIVPHFLDQFYWRERVEDAGIGVPGPRYADATPEALAECVVSMLGDRAILDTAKHMGLELADREPVVIAADHIVETFG